MKRALSLLLLSGAAAFAAVSYFEKGPAEASVRMDLKHTALYLAPDTSCVFGFPDSAPRGLSVSFDSTEPALTAEGRGLDPLRACAGPGAPIGFTLNLKHCRGKADFSGMDVKQLDLSLKGGSFKCLAGKSEPPCSARSVRLNVKRARLWFERLGALNPADLDASVQGGKMVLDFRGANKAVSGRVRVTAGRAVLVFPEKAGVTVTREGRALAFVKSEGFTETNGQWVKKGEGPEISLALSARGGSVLLTTEGDAASLKEAVHEARAERNGEWVKTGKLSDHLRYNRVEGLYLGLKFDSRRIQKAPYGLQATLGYAAGRKLVEYEAGPAFRFGGKRPLNLALMHGKIVQTEDERVISRDENSVQMFLFGDDFMDYYLAKTTYLKGDLRLFRHLTLFGKAHSTFYHPLSKKADFYLFGSDTLSVRDNPTVWEREDHAVVAGARFDNAGKNFPRTGADLSAWAEYSGGGIKSDFTYRIVSGDLRGYRAFSENSELSLRTFAGEVTGKHGFIGIPQQKLFDLGGLSTVRGLGFREDTTRLDKNRMVLISAEFKYYGRVSGGFDAPFIGNMIPRALFILFTDFGSAWNTEDHGRSNETFDNMLAELEPGQFSRCFGIGIADRNENIRLDVTRAYKGGGEEPVDRVQIRFNRAF